MRTIRWASQFKTDFKRELKSTYAKTIDADLRKALDLLANDEPLPESYCDHPLGGAWKGSRDMHIHLDLVLIYAKPLDKAKGNKDLMILRLERMGSHAELKI